MHYCFVSCVNSVCVCGNIFPEYPVSLTNKKKRSQLGIFNRVGVSTSFALNWNLRYKILINLAALGAEFSSRFSVSISCMLGTQAKYLFFALSKVKASSAIEERKKYLERLQMIKRSQISLLMLLMLNDIGDSRYNYLSLWSFGFWNDAAVSSDLQYSLTVISLFLLQ